MSGWGRGGGWSHRGVYGEGAGHGVGAGARVHTHPWWWCQAPCWRCLGTRATSGLGQGGPLAWGCTGGRTGAHAPSACTVPSGPHKAPWDGPTQIHLPHLVRKWAAQGLAGPHPAQRHPALPGVQPHGFGFRLPELRDPKRRCCQSLWELAGPSLPSTVPWGAAHPATWAPYPACGLCLSGCWEAPGGVQGCVWGAALSREGQAGVSSLGIGGRGERG